MTEKEPAVTAALVVKVIEVEVVAPRLLIARLEVMPLTVPVTPEAINPLG